MKKIIVEKSEGIAEVIDRILSEADEEIALVIPKYSALGKSVRNFNLLKRETDAAGKTVMIESVDETILAFAKSASIEASHPLWRSVRGAGGVSDIVASEDEPSHAEKKPEISKKKSVPVKLKVHAEETELEEDHEKNEFEKSPSHNRYFEEVPESRVREDDENSSRKVSSKVWWIVAVVLVILCGAIYGITVFFDRADISITFKQDPWSYQANFVADKSVSSINPVGNVIPAQIFTSTKNITEAFPASSVSNVSQKAQGVITVYNDYSSSPQELVATTRFVTPSGQIFRLINTITVPGALVANGVITPSSINAPIVADQPGPSYNVGPIPHLTVPGFQNDPGRYAGFYGAIASSTSGGFIGTKAVPTVADIKAAEASTTAILQSGLASGFTTNYPNNFKILDGATTYQVAKLLVNTSTDSNGNFTVFGQSTMEAIGFDESALKTYLLSLAQTQQSSSVFASINLDYSSVQANFTTGQVSFALTAQGELEPAFSPSDFTNSILGMSIGDARSSILALPDLQNGTISVWPLWLWKIPTDTNKVHVTAQ